MFGQGLPIRDRFANFRMDYIDFSNLIGDERYHDRLTYDGRWENNIYQFLRRTLMKLTMDIPKPFKMEGVKRIDVLLSIKLFVKPLPMQLSMLMYSLKEEY